MKETKTVKVCTLIASRGLIHSRTIECVLLCFEELGDYGGPHQILFSHDKPIPEAQNYLVKEAMKTNCTHFWFVEEDNVFPRETLKKMLKEEMPVVAVDYPVGSKAYSTIMKKDGEIYWSGLGCTLVDRIVFEEMKEPWFRTDKTWRITDAETMELVEEDVPNKYGGHDINFGMELRKLGIPIVALEGITSGHLRIVQKPGYGNNEGAYEVIENTEIKNYQNY